jgi:D-3-phosphoglycerate dehydrogenase
MVHEADGIIAASRIRYDGGLMDRAPRLCVIARTGAGYDNIAVDEATKRGIAVCTVPDGPTVSTAEHAVALMLAVTKRLKLSDRSLRMGHWDIFNDHDAVELQGTTLGIVGLGKIGGRVARVALAIGMRVIAWDPYVSAELAGAMGVALTASLAELLAGSDVVSIHAPLTPATEGMISREMIGVMRGGAVLVNTARGGLLDEDALVDALDRGALSGAGLDVFAEEPLPTDSRLLGRDDIVVTPHVAAATVASRERLWSTAISEALRVLRGQAPAHVLNPEALAHQRAASPTPGIS